MAPLFLVSPFIIIGVKRRIQTRDVELDYEIHKKYVEVIAEKVTFLSVREQMNNLLLSICCKKNKIM